MHSAICSFQEILRSCESKQARNVIADLKNILDNCIPSFYNVKNILCTINDILILLKRNFVIESKNESKNVLMMKVIHLCNIREKIQEFFHYVSYDNQTMDLYNSIMLKTYGIIGTVIGHYCLKDLENDSYHLINYYHASIVKDRGYAISYYIDTPLIHKINLKEKELFEKDDEICPICLDDFTDGQNVAIMDVCRHKHCATCIEDLFTRKKSDR